MQRGSLVVLQRVTGGRNETKRLPNGRTDGAVKAISSKSQRKDRQRKD